MAANLAHAVPFVEEAVRAGAQLVVLPELFPTGYSFDTGVMWPRAERLADGPTRTWLCAQARQHGIHIGTSFLEASGDQFYNTFALAGPGGELLGTVRKQTPAAVEALLFAAGPSGPDAHVIVCPALGGLRVAVGICYENQLAYMAPYVAAAGAHLLLMPHCAPRVERVPASVSTAFEEAMLETPAAYARALGVPVVFVNKSGPCVYALPGLPSATFSAGFMGGSQVVDSDGTVLAPPTDREDAVVVATVRPAVARGPTELPPGKFSPLTRLPTLLKFMFTVDEVLFGLGYRYGRHRAAAALAVSGGGPSVLPLPPLLPDRLRLCCVAAAVAVVASKLARH